ncbi:MAG: helix-turn-helix domain-containing protein [Ruminococcaceae bacterium]|nr:helix-turn-helix domain-containing protein [Oscillospiraceae bacterium]
MSLKGGISMPYEQEFALLHDTFQKSHVSLSLIAEVDFYALREVNPLQTGIEDTPDFLARKLFLQSLAPYTMYKQTDAYRRAWIYLLLPEREQQEVLLVGPYLASPIGEEEMLEMSEENGISPQVQRTVREYYASLPVLRDTNLLFVMLETFCERIWHRPSFAVVDVNREHHIPASVLSVVPRTDSFDDHLANMKVLEKRYAFENEMIRAVTLGQIHKEKQFLSGFAAMPLEMRSSSPLRSAKNYSIIMNTLLRKAAENGGVHPVYLDRISSDFARKIEETSVLSAFPTLMNEMFRSYCRLVRKHSIRRYSPVVQKAILLIDSDLSAPLTLSTLAAAQGLSEGYLATIFKRETEKTVSEYVREKRMKHAAHLLTTTRLQIQTIALHCGIMDVQYFSKLFKKHTGKTPKEYRETAE